METRIYLSALFILVMWSPATSQDTSCYLNEHLNYDVKGEVRLILQESDTLETRVRLLGQVSVATVKDGSQLKVLELQISGLDGKVYENPPGLEKPVVFRSDDKPLLRNLETEKDDNPASVGVKIAIINILPQQAGNVTIHTQIQDMLNLLEEGNQNIRLNDAHKDIVLVLGNTGAGKSTFTQWIAGTDNVLMVKEISGDFVIEDDLNKISKDTIQSMTTFPELVVDIENNVVYYDLPGFSDTRSSSNDIATSYFTTEVIEHAEAIKLVFLINYSSVRRGVDRNDFVKLLRHATELVRNINKLKHSIALIVTKVDNRYKKSQLIDDDTAINGVGEFLNEVKRSLEQRSIDKVSSVSAKELIFIDNAIKLLDVFLTKDDDEYTRIGLFRRPDDTGILTDMDLLESEKGMNQKMINVFLNYTLRNNEDFGRTLSESSKNEINYLVEDVEKNILFRICDLAHKIKEHFNDLVKQLNTTINSIDVDDVTVADLELSDGRNLLTNFLIEYDVIQNLSGKIKNVRNLEVIPKLIYSEISVLKLDISNKKMLNMLNEGQYLKFLIDSSEKEFNTRISLMAWASAFQNILTDLVNTRNDLQNNIINVSNQLEDKIKTDIENVGKELKKRFSDSELQIPDLKQVRDELKLKHDMFTNAAKYTEPLEFALEIINIARNANVSVEPHIPTTVTKYSAHLDRLRETINKVANYLNDSKIWYTFMIHLYDRLSEYEIQKDISECNYLSKKISQLDDNKVVESTNLKQFLMQCYKRGYEEEYNNIKGIRLDKAKLWHLEKLFDLLLNGATFSCEENGKMIVKGAHVVMSDVVNKACVDPVKFLEIFALDTIYIDEDLVRRGGEIQVAIVAPTWEIIGTREFILHGLQGKFHEPREASSGYYPEGDGTDGAPGNPGDNGGSFLGIGDTFINIVHLIVFTDGGDGGNGQNGGNGGKGKDGTAPHISEDDPARALQNVDYSCYVFYCEYETLSGDYCSDGGNGGRGGVGGYGGLPGRIDFVSTSAQVSLKKSQERGDDGQNGVNGRVGLPGRGGSKAAATWAWLRFWKTTKFVIEDMPGCDIGSNWSGLNDNNILQPKSPKDVDKVVVLDDYKDYVTKSGALIDSLTTEFIKKITYNFRNVY